MSVVRFHQCRDRDYEMDLSGTGQNARANTRWMAKVDSLSDGPEVFYNVPGLPSFGHILLTPTASLLLVRMRPSRHPQDPLWWYLDFSYIQVNTDFENPRNRTIHPLERPPEVEYSNATKMKAFITDIDGKPVVSSSRERFDPPPEDEKGYQVLRITRNQATFDPQQSADYFNAVNSDPVLGAAAEKILCKVYNGRTVFDQWEGANISYWQVVLELHHDAEDGWDFQTYDQGFYELVDDGMVGNKIQKHMTDAYGSFITIPKFLDGNGAHLGESPDMVPVTLTFKNRKRRSFAALGFE